MFDWLFQFFREGLWIIPYDPNKKVRSFFLRLLRVIVATFKGISKDECFLKASALTYYSLLSIVPVLAVAFGIAKGFGFEQILETEILNYWREQPETATKILGFTYSLLEQTKGGFIAGVGVIVLLWTVLRLLETIEHTLNDIWKVSEARPLIRKLSDYTTTVILCPIFFAISSSLTVYMSTAIHEASQGSKFIDAIYPIVLIFYYLIPLFMAWMLFTFVYSFLPNTTVSWRAAFMAGMIAGTSYYFLQWVYIHFQIGVSSYSAIYGSFAAIPLFLVWLNMSWLILLVGAEMAFQIQENEEWILLSKLNKTESIKASKQLIALLIVHECVQNFKRGLPPFQSRQLAQEIGLSSKTIEEILNLLIKANLLYELSDKEEIKAYLPARNINTIQVKSICDALDESSAESFIINESESYARLKEVLDNYMIQAASDPSNLVIAKLIEE